MPLNQTAKIQLQCGAKIELGGHGLKSATTEETAFTGQPLIAFEQVACTKCSHPVGLRSSGWFDSYRDTYGKGGTYVHYGCLSPQRLAEIAAMP